MEELNVQETDQQAIGLEKLHQLEKELKELNVVSAEELEKVITECNSVASQRKEESKKFLDELEHLFMVQDRIAQYHADVIINKVVGGMELQANFDKRYKEVKDERDKTAQEIVYQEELKSKLQEVEKLMAVVKDTKNEASLQENHR